MSQPSLSRILGGLENELGVRLFVRSRRGVELTEAGTYFRARAAGIVTQVDGLVSELRLRARSPGGRIAVGLPIVMTELITEPLAAWFVREFPRAQLSIQEGISDELEFETSLGRLDLAVLISADTRARNLETTPLASEQVYLHAAHGTNLSVDQPVTWQAVAGLPLILPRQSNFLRRKIEEASRRHRFPLNVVMEVNTPSSILSLVEQGAGYTVLPGSASYRQRDHGLVSAAPLRDFKVSGRWYATEIQHSRRWSSPPKRKLGSRYGANPNPVCGVRLLDPSWPAENRRYSIPYRCACGPVNAIIQ